MGVIPMDKFSLNEFYDKTPVVLKYILVISLIVVGSYVFIGKRVTKGQDRQLEKIEQTIETSYVIIDRFDDFRKAQYIYNDEMISHLKNIYTLVEELNESTNRKFDLILSAGQGNTAEILDRLTLLNESFEKLQKAYTPDEFEQPSSNVPDPRKEQEYSIVAEPVKSGKLN